MDVVADLPADAQAAEPVQQRERGFHDPPVDTEARAVLGAAPGDVRGVISELRTRGKPRTHPALR